jgi:hypothetical protein
VNAVERLWRAIAARDVDAVLAQLHPHARIELPAAGTHLTATQYAAAQRARPAASTVEVRSIAPAADNPVAVHVVVSDDAAGAWHGAAYYELQTGRISSGLELWVPAGGATLPPWLA